METLPWTSYTEMCAWGGDGRHIATCNTLACGGHFGGSKTAAKVLQSGFFWPTLFKDAYVFVASCDRCQRTGNNSSRNQMPLNNILEVELFDVRGIDFMGPFPESWKNKYIWWLLIMCQNGLKASLSLPMTPRVLSNFSKKYFHQIQDSAWHHQWRRYTLLQSSI